MHRLLKDLLQKARGDSQFVLALFLDVRGFSSFARLAESSEAAVFLRSAYNSILDNYFADASFFKPTGDGLLIVQEYEADTLTAVVNDAVRASLKIVTDFPELTSGDPMINFPVPSALGIGMARGAATRLISGDQVLDYSGRALNLAARLMDLARPSGVVFSANMNTSLLEEDLLAQFQEEQVYVKGIAEDEPITVYYLNDQTVIPNFNKAPMLRYDWHVLPPEQLTFRELRDRGRYMHRLPSEPFAEEQSKVYVRHPKPTSGKRQHKTLMTTHTYTAEHVVRAGEYYAKLNYAPVIDALTRLGVGPTWPVTVTVEYIKRP